MRNIKFVARGFSLALSIGLLFGWLEPVFGGGVIPPRQDPNKIEWVTGEVLVKFKDDVDIRPVKGYKLIRTGIASIDALNRKYEVKEMEKVFKTAKKRKEKKYIRTYIGEVIEVPQLFNWYKLKVVSTNSIRAIVDAYKNDPNVEYAEPNYIARICVEPNDPDYGRQWGLPAIHAPEAWDIEKGDSTVIIGILDTGVEWDHPDLTDKIWINETELNGTPGVDDDGNGYIDDIRGWSWMEGGNNDPYDDNGHGSHVAGIAGASTDNGIGIAGTSWGSKMMIVKVLSHTGTGSYGDIAEGVTYAADNGAKVINLSLGGYADSYVLREALENAYTTTVIVAAAGNGHCSVDYPPPPTYRYASFFPAAYSFVLGVEAAKDASGSLPYFSNIDPNGPEVTNNGYNYEVRAPGVHIYSTLIPYSYASWNGTSMAAPFVSGTVALLRSYFPDWSNELLMGQIIQTSGDVINAYAALTTTPEPVLASMGYTIIDTLPGCDGDGVADAGETIEMVFTVKNFWAQANTVEMSLSLAHPIDTSYLSFVDSVATFGGISAYAEGNNADNPFVLDIHSSAPNNRNILIGYEITCSYGNPVTGTFWLTVQRGTEISGIISENTTWTNDYLYIVTANVLVDSGVTLTIEPGTRIQFDSTKYLRVDGCLKAIGTPNSMILFTSNCQTHQPGDWEGIRFTDKSVDAVFDANGNYISGSIIKYAEIELGEGISIEASSPYIAQNSIRSNSHFCGGAIRVTENSTPKIESNLISDNVATCPGGICGGGGININSSGPEICRNTIEGNKSFFIGGGIFIIYPSGVIITQNLIRNNNTCHTSMGYGGGGGISIHGDGNAIINNNVISGNRCNEIPPYSANGGGVHFWNLSSSNIQFENNIIMNNRDGIAIQNGSATIDSNNILGNRKTASEYNIHILEGSGNTSAQHNYWGTTNTDSIDEWIWDYYDDFDLGIVTYQPFETTPIVDAPGFLYQVEFNPPPPIGCEIDTFTLIFSKPMDISIQPEVSFGVCDPWTQHIVTGNWIDSTHWKGTYTFNIMTGDGINNLRVTTAQDCEGMEIPKDTRFSFVVDAAGASSIGFIAQGGDNKVDLQWPKPELVDLMGYNMYRYQIIYQDPDSTVYSDTTLINTSMILDTSYTDETAHNDTTYFYMFTAISTDFKESDYSHTASATPMAAPEPPVLSLPANGSATNNPTITFVWHPSISPDISYYTLEYANNPGFTDSTRITTTDTFYTVPSPLSDTTYYWRVRATNTATITGNWSPSWSFEIDTQSPEAPNLISPVSGIYLKDSLVIFEWTPVTKVTIPNYNSSRIRGTESEVGQGFRLATMSQTRSSLTSKKVAAKKYILKPITYSKFAPIRYVLQIDTAATFDNPIVDTTASIKDTIVLIQNRYYWRVKAYDLAGNESVFSNPDSFGVDITVPSIPQLASPDSGIITNDSTVTFVWYSSTDNLSGVDYYILQYALDSGFSESLVETTMVETTFTAVMNDTTYCWRVKAIDRATNESDWSAVWNITIDTQIPNVPTLILPSDSSWLNDISVAFEWSKVPKARMNINKQKGLLERFGIRTHSLGGKASPVQYVLQIDTTESFTSPVVDTIAETVDTINLDENKYYWRVQAFDEAENESDYSNPFWFVVDTTMPIIDSTTVLEDTIDFWGPFEIKTKVTDNSPLYNPVLFYRTSADTIWKADTMVSLGVSWFIDSIPELPHDSLVVDYYLTVEDFATNKSRDPVSGSYSFTIKPQVGIEAKESTPEKFVLFSPAPNPSLTGAIVKYGLPEKASINLRLYDISGRLVRTLYSGTQGEGYYKVKIQQNELAQGIYFIRFKTDSFVVTRKLTILR